jgi:hypothetical protein
VEFGAALELVSRLRPGPRLGPPVEQRAERREHERSDEQADHRTHDSAALIGVFEELEAQRRDERASGDGQQDGERPLR